MKYIILVTEDGQHLPVLFPDALTHCFVAGAMQLAVDTLDPKKDLRPRQLDSLLEAGSAKVVSAGFVNIGDNVAVHGMSESLNGIASRPVDAGYIRFGDTVAFSDEHLVSNIMQHLAQLDG